MVYKLAVFFKIETVSPFAVEMGDHCNVKFHQRSTVHLMLWVNRSCVKCILEKRLCVLNVCHTLRSVCVLDKAGKSVLFQENKRSIEKSGTIIAHICANERFVHFCNHLKSSEGWLSLGTCSLYYFMKLPYRTCTCKLHTTHDLKEKYRQVQSRCLWGILEIAKHASTEKLQDPI